LPREQQLAPFTRQRDEPRSPKRRPAELAQAARAYHARVTVLPSLQRARRKKRLSQPTPPPVRQRNRKRRYSAPAARRPPAPRLRRARRPRPPARRYALPRAATACHRRTSHVTNAPPCRHVRPALSFHPFKPVPPAARQCVSSACFENEKMMRLASNEMPAPRQQQARQFYAQTAPENVCKGSE